MYRTIFPSSTKQAALSCPSDTSNILKLPPQDFIKLLFMLLKNIRQSVFARRKLETTPRAAVVLQMDSRVTTHKVKLMNFTIVCLHKPHRLKNRLHLLFPTRPWFTLAEMGNLNPRDTDLERILPHVLVNSVRITGDSLKIHILVLVPIVAPIMKSKTVFHNRFPFIRTALNNFKVHIFPGETPHIHEISEVFPLLQVYQLARVG